MICNVCDPANGCSNSSTGVHMFLISSYLICHFQPSKTVCEVLFTLLFLEYPLTQLEDVDYKMVTTKLLESDVSISKSKLECN